MSEDYEGRSDDSSVSVYREEGKCWLEICCNDVSRRLQIYAPDAGSLVVDEGRLDRRYPICADRDADVAFVAERLGLRVVA